MSTDVLGPGDIELFVESGYTVVRQAFTARQAAAASECPAAHGGKPA
jgi:hypothetical protein